MSRTLSGSYATPLQLDFVPSRRLALVLAAAHGCALMLLPFTGLDTGYGLALALLLCASGWHAWCGCTAVASRSFIRGLSWGSDDRVELVRPNGESASMQLQADACVTPWLVVLRLRDARGQTHHLPVLPDMLPRAQFRRLRVRLRLDVPRLAGSRT
jgi:hypothetical protein